MADRNPKNSQGTRLFTKVPSSTARIAREKQRRQYEQQKREKLIFALFIVVIIVMLLFAILIFKKIIGDRSNPETKPVTTTTAAPVTTTPETTKAEDPTGHDTVMVARSQIGKGLLVLIDGTHPLAEQISASALEEIYSSRTWFDKGEKKVHSYYTSDTTPVLEKTTLAALNAMADDFYRLKGNNDLFVDKAYAGTTGEHASGYAVDLGVYTIDNQHYTLGDSGISADFAWVLSNYQKYGFILRYPADKAGVTGVSDDNFHFRYVGKVHATAMTAQGLTLEEYLQLLRTRYTSTDGTGGLSVDLGGGEAYSVYYVAASGGDVDNLPIPAGCTSYTISGDNMNGYVVTARVK